MRLKIVLWMALVGALLYKMLRFVLRLWFVFAIIAVIFWLSFGGVTKLGNIFKSSSGNEVVSQPS
jgi:hypothetical protein